MTNATPAHSVSGLQEVISLVENVYTRNGLATNVMKIKILAQEAPE